MPYPHDDAAPPQVPWATGAVVLTADQLEGGDLFGIVNAGALGAVTTLDNLGSFVGNGTVIALAGDVLGPTG